MTSRSKHPWWPDTPASIDRDDQTVRVLMDEVSEDYLVIRCGDSASALALARLINARLGT